MKPCKSDKSVASKRCCNRNSCLFDLVVDQNCTSFNSAQDSTSTRFLYFGQNFQNHPSGEIQEFKDCGSETEICPNANANATATIDPSNYGNVLKQIIAMSQNLLNQIEQQNKSSMPCCTGRAIQPDPYCCKQQSPTKFSLTNIQAQTCGAKTSHNIRMLQIEPVQITVPFMLQFRNTGTSSPPCSSGIIGQGPSMTFRPVVEIPQISSKPVAERFPCSPATQADIYISEGKFPQVKENTFRCEDIGTRVSFPNINFSCESEDQDNTCTIGTSKDPDVNEMECHKLDKEIQTEHKHRKKQCDNDKQIQTEFPDDSTEANSDRNNSHIEPDSQLIFKVESSEQQLPNDILEDKTLIVVSSQRVSFTAMTESGIVNEGDSSQRLPEEEQIKLYEELEQRRQSQLQEKQLQVLLEEQQLYEKPPAPPMDYSENKSMSSKLPQNMNYPTQFGRCDPQQTTTNITCSSNALYTNVNQIGIPIYCQCMCKTETPCAEPCSNETSVEQETSHFSCRSFSNQPCSDLCMTQDDDFLSAESGSESDVSQNKEEPCKKKIHKNKTASSSCVDLAVLQVLEGMMKVLVTMNSKQTCNRGSSAIKIQKTSRHTEISQSSIVCGFEEDERLYSVSELSSLHSNKEMSSHMIQTIIDGVNNTCSEEFYDETCEGKVEETTKKPCDDNQDLNECSCEPHLIIKFDPNTGIPCCCLYSGMINTLIPVLDISPQSIDGPCTSFNRIKMETEQQGFTTDEYDDEVCENIFIHDEIISETQIRVVTTEEGPDDGNINEEDFVTGDVRVEATLSTETQTENNQGVNLTSTGPPSTDLLDELRAFRDELYESESCHHPDNLRMVSLSSKSKSGGDIRSECDCCHCRAQRRSLQPVCNSVEQCRTEIKFIVDAVIADLEAMEMVRRQNMHCQENLEQPIGPPKGARKSYPVTITEVSELGKCSLYVKWTIHDCYGISGYEIYVDGYLANRYFNSRHEAAVICEIDVKQPHKIALVAKPKDTTSKAIVGAGDIYGDDTSIPIPPNWSPSIYLYEPSNALDYMKMF